MRRERRVERLLDAGAEILAERGPHGLTMRDVAERAGTSGPNLYRYVAGKEELIYLVKQRVLDRAIRSAEAALALRGAKEQVRSLVTDHIRRVLALPAEARLLQDVAQDLPDHLRRRVDALREQYLDLVRAIVSGVAPSKGLKRAAADRRVQLLLGMADRVALDAAGHTPAPRPDRLARPVLAMFHGGVKADR
ncbi:MAG: helix-turn-helix domain containing protein [Planctomycetota bacterium]|nr:helix-turn-helix domain containing protein [Planctomycetota bacterium]